MATITWPTERCFRPAAMSFGSTTSKSGFQGFYTGDRQTTSHLSDRLRCEMTLGPVATAAEAGRRSALLMALDSTGDYASFGALHHRYPSGTISGSPTLTSTVAAAVRSIGISAALSRPNMLFGSSFEIDTDANGLCDGWALYSGGTTGTVTPASIQPGSGNGSLYAQRITAAGLGATSSDFAGIAATTATAVVPGRTYTLAADFLAGFPCDTNVLIVWYTSGLAQTGTPDRATSAASTTTYTRKSVTGVAPALAAYAKPHLYINSAAGGPTTALVVIDNVQLEAGSTASTYAGLATLLAGDYIGLGGNLLQIGYAGAAATDAGVMASVPLALPMQRAATSGAAISWSNPTGLWQLDADGISHDYSPGSVQQGVALQFRQVIL